MTRPYKPLSAKDLKEISDLSDDDVVIVRTNSYGDTELETVDAQEIDKITESDDWYPAGHERHLMPVGELRALSDDQ